MCDLRRRALTRMNLVYIQRLAIELFLPNTPQSPQQYSDLRGREDLTLRWARERFRSASVRRSRESGPLRQALLAQIPTDSGGVILRGASDILGSNTHSVISVDRRAFLKRGWILTQPTSGQIHSPMRHATVLSLYACRA